MKTTELFSMAVIVKDLGLVLVRLSSILQNECVSDIDVLWLETWLSENWGNYSLLRGLQFSVIPDCTQVEGYEILVHRVADPHILLSVNFNLS